jgi:uncharacterized membrane protein YozB (DUF420 family)
MPSEAAVSKTPRHVVAFAVNHRWDREFSLAITAMIWAGIVLGFGTDLVRHFATPHVAYPLIVHFHAVVFGGWLAVLTTQIWLIRKRRPHLHRKLGTAAMALAAIMIVLGPATAIAMQRAQFGTSESDPSFLAAQFLSILSFAGLVASAFAMRKNPSAHKRLMLLATLVISDAGFARWLGTDVHAVLGSGFGATLGSIYLGSDVLVASLGAYDLITRHRLHPAYVTGVTWLVIIQLAAVILMRDPHWKLVALMLIGHRG